MMQTLINKLREVGWKLLISADVSAKCVKTKDAQYQLGKFQKQESSYFFYNEKFSKCLRLPFYFLDKNGKFVF